MSILEHAIPVASQEPFDPRLLIDRVSASFPGVYSKGVGVSQGYTLEEHTLMVLGQYGKYFSSSPLPAGLDHSHFRLFLAIHDIGKPKAVEEGNKRMQGEYNPVLFEDHFPRDPFIEERHRSLLWSLLKGDPIGTHLKYGGRELDRVLEELEGMYGHTKYVTRSDYMDILLIYYMSDAGSYTLDAGPKSGLDHLFRFSGVSMDFSARSKPLVDVLVDRFTNS